MSSSPEHKALVARACHWLQTTGKMGVVLSEPCSHSSIEHPDALGWNCRGWSILVECKVSRSDFVRDVLKRQRWWEDRQHIGCGQERYYMTQPGLLPPGDIPEGWGLLEVGKRIRRVVVPPLRERIAGCLRDPDPRILIADWPLIYGHTL